ncbi:hypothetical protein Aca07nite_71830 [Actinoplanes capillaceus]|uniref:SHOCT domain-containing protein n=1 Tax=Actinoplanes campanulatus TaxID=113559 RepID=A0ABQ3WUR8_9ACTN|nr:hypothetical protein [Actinoplanes capillaceus]GID49908.1 hypothetical protein Aca07nite_71830 [Actinoplanes capillaceus]
MFSSFCGAMGLAGWLVMLLFWVALIAAVVWGITRLFPDRSEVTVLAQPGQHQGEDVVSSLVESRPR